MGRYTCSLAEIEPFMAKPFSELISTALDLTIRQWHQNRPGCAQPMPVNFEKGSSHISGVKGLTPSHSMMPSRASQTLPHEVLQ